MSKQNRWLLFGIPLIALGLGVFIFWVSQIPLEYSPPTGTTQKPIEIVNRDQVLQSLTQQNQQLSSTQAIQQITNSQIASSTDTTIDRSPVAKADPNPGPPVSDQEVKTIANQILTGLQSVDNDSDANSPFKAKPRGVGNRVSNPDQQAAIDDLLNRLGSDASLDMDQVSRTLRRLDGDLQSLVEDSETYRNAQAQQDFGGMALALADEIGEVMRINSPSDEFQPREIKNDHLGMTHVRMQQTFGGIPIYGGEVGVHFNSNGEPYQISGTYAPSPSRIDPSVETYSAEHALTVAQNEIPNSHIELIEPEIEKVIYWDIDRAPVVTWQVEMVPDLDEHWHVFVSVNSGLVIHKSNHACSQAVVANAADLEGINRQIDVWQEGTTYYAIDTTRQMYDASSTPPDLNNMRGAIIIRDLDFADIDAGSAPAPVETSNTLNGWDPTAVSVLHNFTIVEDYYRNTFQRNSIDDNGMNIMGLIHATFSGNSDNAFWNGGLGIMIFGDGSSAFRDLPKSLDVAGHELTHGVINHSANLRYENQSGALNEHIADFFGAMVDRDEWFMGDGVTVGKDGLRDMIDPGNPNVLARQPTTFSEFANLPNTRDGDWGGVHVNSGIPNRMSYLLAEGPQGIGRDKAENIIYRALTVYLRPLSQFIDYRTACLDAARDIHGDGSPEMQSVAAAFDAVEITTNQVPDNPRPDDSTPGEVGDGEEQFLVLHADLQTQDPIRQRPFYQLLLGTPEGTFEVTQQLVAETRPAISGDGKWGLYINSQNNIFWTDGIEQRQWTTTGDVRSIAMSKNQRFIVFTTIDFDNLIYVIDTTKDENDPNVVRAAVLEFPDTVGNMNTLDFADIMSFNFRGDTLVFDARDSVENGDGTISSNWGIYEMRMTDLSITQLITQVPNELIANPIFAHASDHLLLADYRIIEGGNAFYGVLSIDLNQGFAKVVQELPGQLGQPTHRGDDQSVLFRILRDTDRLDLLLENRLTQDRQAFESTQSSILLSTESIFFYPIGFRDVNNYTEQKPDISVPPAISFANTEVNTVTTQQVTIANTGNADLEIVGLELQGANAAEFSHNGTNRNILVGQNMTFNVMFRPNATGAKQAELHVLSSDFDESEVVISLSGQAIASTQATPTNTPQIIPTPTFTPPVVPTNTPFIPATPTFGVPTATPQIPGGDNLIVFEFGQSTIAENQWVDISPGFADPNVFSNGIVGLNPLPQGRFGESIDQRGISFVVSPSQLNFIRSAEAVQTDGKPVLLQAVVWAENPNATITLGALKGSFSGGTVDGSIGLSTIQSAQAFTAQPRKIVLLYEPDSTDAITPFIQVVSNSNQFPSVIWVDKLEVLKLEPAVNYPGAIFSSN